MEGNTKLLFSVTVHESYEAINDLIKSILKSYKNSYIILHVNKLWNNFDESQIIYINEYVFVNNKYRYPLTDRLQGKTGIHISNIEYFNTLNIDYDYTILCASNELYIKEIEINHIKKNEYGSDFLSVSKNSIYHESIPHHDSDFVKSVVGDSLDDIAYKNGIFGGRHEGMFFSKQIATEMISIYRKKFHDANNVCRCDEEIIPHTILYNIVLPTETESLCYFSSFENKIDYELIRKFYNKEIKEFSDYFTKYDKNVDCKFSIKGVSRNDNELRLNISKLIGY